jgi:hypothetical protein
VDTTPDAFITWLASDPDFHIVAKPTLATGRRRYSSREHNPERVHDRADLGRLEDATRPILDSIQLPTESQLARRTGCQGKAVKVWIHPAAGDPTAGIGDCGARCCR